MIIPITSREGSSPKLCTALARAEWMTCRFTMCDFAAGYMTKSRTGAGNLFPFACVKASCYKAVYHNTANCVRKRNQR